MARYVRWSIKEPNWARPSLEEGREFLCRFVPAFPARLAYLERVTDISWVYSHAPVPDLKQPLSAFCSWAESLPLWKYYPRAGRRISVMVNNPRHADHLKALEKNMQEEPMFDLTPTGESISRDLSMLIGEAFRVRFPWLYWTVGDDPRYDDHGHVAVGGGGVHGNWNLKVIQLGFTLLSNAKEQNTDLLAEITRLWSNLAGAMSLNPCGALVGVSASRSRPSKTSKKVHRK